MPNSIKLESFSRSWYVLKMILNQQLSQSRLTVLGRPLFLNGIQEISYHPRFHL